MPKKFDANEAARELLNRENPIGQGCGERADAKSAGLLDLLQNHYSALSTENQKTVFETWFEDRCKRKEGDGDIFTELFQFIRIDLAKLALGLPQDPMDFKLTDRLQNIIKSEQFGRCSLQFQRWLTKEHHFVTEHSITGDTVEDCTTHSDLLRFASWFSVAEKEPGIDAQ